MITYYTIENGKITQSADWQFPGSIETDREIVRGYDGGLYFAGEEPADSGPSAEQQIAEIRARLTEIDLDSVRPLRAIAAGEATEADHDKLTALASEASALREQLAILTEQAS